jgi:predicted flap endonuclease-1-like 5' DNA nuclease
VVLKAHYILIDDVKNMIGVIVFIIIFVLFLLLPFAGISLPIGDFVVRSLFPDPAHTTSAALIEGSVNGLIYGFLVWLYFSIAWMLYNKMQKSKTVTAEVEKRPVIREVSTRSSNVEEIEGIGPIYGKMLNKEGIKTTDDLLEAGSTKQGRKDLADKTALSEHVILEWVNRADLFRIKGVGEEYSDLLEEAGVDTVVELARRNPENLHITMVSVNEVKKLVRRTPTLDDVKDWIEQAKRLGRKIEY